MFLNQVSFQAAIEELVRERKVSYMEGVIEYCKENDIDVEDIAKLVSSNLKDKIRMDAIAEGHMKGTAMLPI